MSVMLSYVHLKNTPTFLVWVRWKQYFTTYEFLRMLFYNIDTRSFFVFCFVCLFVSFPFFLPSYLGEKTIQWHKDEGKGNSSQYSSNNKKNNIGEWEY